MEIIIKKRVFGLLLLTIVTYADARLTGRSFFSPRSQGVDAARQLVGWQPYINQYLSPDQIAETANQVGG